GSPRLAPLRHKYRVESVAFSPDSHLLATGSGDWEDSLGEVRFWDATTGAERGTTLHFEQLVRWLAFSPDGRTLLTACRTSEDSRDDQNFRLWDVPTGIQCGEPLRYSDYVGRVAFASDGRTVLLETAQESAVVWNPLPAVEADQPGLARLRLAL